MRFVRGNVHKIAGLQFYRSILDSTSRCTLQYNHQIMLVLVEPETLLRNMFVGNIPLHADAGGYQQLRKDFVRTFCRMIDE